MRLSLDLSLPVLSALFAGGFPGPVESHGQVFLVDRVIGVIGDEAPYLKPVQWDEIGNPVLARDATIDLSIPWVHEHVAATCLRLLGVPNVRAACMVTTGPVHTLRWVSALDGLPYSASWHARLNPGGPTGFASSYRNDLLSSGLKQSQIPAISIKPNATCHEVLAALLFSLDKRTVPS